MLRQLRAPTLVVFSILSAATAPCWLQQAKADPSEYTVSFDTWLASEQKLAIAKISDNLLPNGALLASPSRSAPNYYYHWTRDAALTINVVLDTYLASSNPDERAALLEEIKNYVDFSVKIQAQPTLSGRIDDHFANLGEPKFEVNGRGFSDSWGRPQTDGPALRALSLMRIYAVSVQRSDAQQQFSSNLDNLKRAILTDLEYTAYHWRDSGFDLWEEIRGQHFYNALAQRRALLAGAAFVKAHLMAGDADLYLYEARAIEAQIGRFWDSQRGYLIETINRTGGIDYKASNLDTGVILAALHSRGQPDYFGPSDERILATAHVLRTTFAGLFQINQTQRDPNQSRLAPAIGRYPEDRYDGIGNSLGHPWFITTAALAELNYRAALNYLSSGRVVVTPVNEAFFKDLPLTAFSLRRGDHIDRNDPRFFAVLGALLSGGDEYLARVRYHAAANGDLSEQIDRYTGFERGAYDLSWSYASVLTAGQARSELITALRP